MPFQNIRAHEIRDSVKDGALLFWFALVYVIFWLWSKRRAVLRKQE